MSRFSPASLPVPTSLCGEGIGPDTRSDSETPGAVRSWRFLSANHRACSEKNVRWFQVGKSQTKPTQQ